MGTSETMRCAYCGKEKPWTWEHFPLKLYAQCQSCINREFDALHPRWAANLFAVLLAPVVLLWWIVARLYLAIGTRLRKEP